MPYLMRMNVRPDERKLPTKERDEMNRNFNLYAAEVYIHGEPVAWDEIEEVEIVTAPTVGGLSTWLMQVFAAVETEDRYHLGIYLRRDEAVLANINKQQVLYALNAIAYHAPRPVRYKGPDGLVPLTSI